MTPKIQAEIDRIEADYDKADLYDKGRLSGLKYAIEQIEDAEQYNNWLQSVFDGLNG